MHSQIYQQIMENVLQTDTSWHTDGLACMM